MEKYFEINEQGHNVRAKLYCEKVAEIKKVMIFCTGFAGHKDNGTAKKFATKILTKYKGIAVVVFNWPCHGDDVKKKIKFEDCLTYIELVNNYVTNTFHTDEIYMNATSFGGYLVLKYISENGNPFQKIVLRSPAINMYDVIVHTIMEEGSYDKLLKGKNILVGFDRKIEINPQFIEDLKDNDIRTIDYVDFADDILIFHGTKDEVVPFADSVEFSENNIIELIPVEGADHRYQNPRYMDLVMKHTFEFFGF